LWRFHSILRATRLRTRQSGSDQILCNALGLGESELRLLRRSSLVRGGEHASQAGVQTVTLGVDHAASLAIGWL
jgi:hypothetical protein